MNEEILNTQEQLSKKERRDLRRQEKVSSQGGGVFRKKAKKVFWAIIIAVIIFVAVWQIRKLYIAGKPVNFGPVGQDFSREYASLGQKHIDEGTLVKSYNSNPPTSGDHWPVAVLDGVYDMSQPDEGLVHSLEHGRIWISYKSSIPESAKAALRRIGKSEQKIIVTVRDTNDSEIAVAAWQRLDTFNLGDGGAVDEKRIHDFIERYRDQAPEKNIPAMVGKVY
ncbi:MAG: DUF3105 domain-containing protein [Patescibacteria group bacterium]